MTAVTLNHPITTRPSASQRGVSLLGWGSAMSVGAVMWWMLFALI